MSSRRAMVWMLAPAAPPCFADRLTWLEFLASAAEEQRPGRPLVLLMPADESRPPAFNHDYPFCAACTAPYQQSMQQQGRCRPTWLTDMRTQESTSAAA